MIDLINTTIRGRPRSDVRRVQLLTAAFELIAEVGFEGLRTRAVAERVGVNIATVHYYFPSKSDLIQSLLHHALERFRTVKAPSVEPSPYAELLQEFLDLEFHLTQEPELFRVLNELQLHAGRHPELRNLLAEMERGWRGYLVGQIQTAQAQGRLTNRVAPEQIALEMMALLRGASLLHSSGYPSPSLAEAGERYLRALLPTSVTKGT